MEECYRQYFGLVSKFVGSVLDGVDQETVVHEVFFRLISDDRRRRSFNGGPLGPWLGVMARNLALDFIRARRKEQLVEPCEHERIVKLGARQEERIEARLLIERFRNKMLPSNLRAAFDVRFLQQLPQREAAQKLGIHRATLVYHEMRIRAWMKRFLLLLED